VHKFVISAFRRPLIKISGYFRFLIVGSTLIDLFASSEQAVMRNMLNIVTVKTVDLIMLILLV